MRHKLGLLELEDDGDGALVIDLLQVRLHHLRLGQIHARQQQNTLEKLALGLSKLSRDSC